LREEFIIALIAEMGIITIALIYDAEYIEVAIGVLLGLLGGYGITKGKTTKNKSEG